MKKKAMIFILALALLVSFVAADSYYIPDGYVSADASTFMHILNPGDGKADLDITIHYPKDVPVSSRISVEPESVKRIDLSKYASGSFGVVVESDSFLVVDSVKYDSAYSAGFGSAAASDADVLWYFGEGYSSGLVKTYLNILNPGQNEADVEVTLYYDNGQKKTFKLFVPAGRQLRTDLKERTMPEKRFGIKVSSTRPVVVSANTFNKHFSAGSGGVGTDVLSKRLYIADGLATDEVSSFVNVLNPSLGIAHLKVTLYYEDGSSDSFSETVEAGSKKAILLNNNAEKGKRFSVVIDSDISVAVESVQYDDAHSAGQGSMAVPGGSDELLFAYAMVSSKVDGYLAVFNPSSKESDLRLTLFYEDGSVQEKEVKAPSMMRTTIRFDDLDSSGRAFGIRIGGSEPVVAELVYYDGTFSAGYGYFGVPGPAPDDEKELVVEVPADLSSGEFSAAPVEYSLVKESDIPRSKMNGAVQPGLMSVLKMSYDYGGSDVVAWRLSYASVASASAAVESILEGGLFVVLDSSASRISGHSVHEVVSDNSAGVVWQNESDVYLFIAGKDERGIAEGLAGEFASATPVEERDWRLSYIVTLLAALIFLVVVIRWFSRKSAEDESVWEDMIPSAKPETREQKRKKRVKKAEAKKEDPMPKPAPEKKEEAKKEVPAKKERAPEPKPKEEKEKPEEKKEKPGEEESAEPKEGKEPEKKRPAQEQKGVRITEKQDRKVTAQDLLDEIDDIPDYEDVFRHVNRDQEEIKPR